MVLAIILVLGYLIGGVMTMFIYRWPNETKIFSRRKDKDGNYTKWYESIPILGYLIKRFYPNGDKKSINEVIVPLLNMLCYLALYLIFGEVVGNYLFMAIVSCFIVVSFIDYKYMLIPDRIHIIILIAGIIATICDHYLYFDEYGEIFQMSTLDHILGLVLGFFPIWILGIIVSKIKHKEALGGGDIKLLGAAGLFLGWKNILLAIVMAACLALIIEKILQALKIREKGAQFPFGPYLCLAMTICVMVGPTIINWYIGLFNGNV